MVEFDAADRVVSIEEKPAAPRSHFAATGLYFLDQRASAIAATLTPSRRGEYEIVDLLKHYLARDELHVELMGRGFAWLDTGTMETLIEAAEYVRVLEKRQGLRIACPEEVAFERCASSSGPGSRASPIPVTRLRPISPARRPPPRPD